MIRLPHWLYVLCIPVMFIGGCTVSLRPMWNLEERLFTRPVGEKEQAIFPILVVSESGKYGCAYFGRIPTNNKVVTKLDHQQLDQINRDLGDSIGNKQSYPYFNILSVNANGINVQLEEPTRRDYKRQSWYTIIGDNVVPSRILSYGAGYAFVVLLSCLCFGLVCIALFLTVFRSKK